MNIRTYVLATLLLVAMMLAGCSTRADRKLERVIQERNEKMQQPVAPATQEPEEEKRREILPKYKPTQVAELDGHRVLQQWELSQGVIYIVEKHFVENPEGIEDVYASVWFFPRFSNNGLRQVVVVCDINGVAYDPTGGYTLQTRIINREIDRCWENGHWKKDKSMILVDMDKLTQR